MGRRRQLRRLRLFSATLRAFSQLLCDVVAAENLTHGAGATEFVGKFGTSGEKRFDGGFVVPCFAEPTIF